MKRRIPIAVLACGVLLGGRGEAGCIDWAASGPFAEIEAADVVFEGTVARIEEDASSECADDRVALVVSRVWKGEEQPEYVLLQRPRRIVWRTVEGQRLPHTCPVSSVEPSELRIGEPYVVFAVPNRGGLVSMNCDVTAPPRRETRKRLDAWKRAQAQKSE